MSDTHVPADLAHLKVEGPTKAAELYVYDHAFGLQHAGVGEIETFLPRGLYQVEARVANRSQRLSLDLELGNEHVVRGEEWSLRFRSAAPLLRSSTSREVHQDNAEVYSLAPTWTGSGAGDCRLFVFGRYTRRDANGKWLPAPSAFWSGLRLERVDGGSIIEFTDGVVGQPSQGWFALTADLPAGCYVLTAPGSSSSSAVDDRLCLPIWLQPSFETHLFIPVADWHILTEVSLSLAPKGHGFRLRDADGSATRFALEAELAESLLAGARRDKNLANTDVLRRFLSDEICNPFAGIVAVGALRVSESPPWKLLREVVDRLRAILGEHPDVLALEVLLGRETDQRIVFPPILRHSFDALLTQATTRAHPLALEGCMEEAIGGIIPSQFTVWRRKGAPDEEGSLATMGIAFLDAMTATVGDLTRAEMRPSRRIQQLEKAAANFTDWLSRQDLGTLAAQIGLPRVLVERSVVRLTMLVPLLRRALATIQDTVLGQAAATALESGLGAQLLDALSKHHPAFGITAAEKRVLAAALQLWDAIGDSRDELSIESARARRRFKRIVGQAIRAHYMLKDVVETTGSADSEWARAAEDAMIAAAALSVLSAGLPRELAVGRGLGSVMLNERANTYLINRGMASDEDSFWDWFKARLAEFLVGEGPLASSVIKSRGAADWKGTKVQFVAVEKDYWGAAFLDTATEDKASEDRNQQVIELARSLNDIFERFRVASAAAEGTPHGEPSDALSRLASCVRELRRDMWIMVEGRESRVNASRSPNAVIRPSEPNAR